MLLSRGVIALTKSVKIRDLFDTVPLYLVDLFASAEYPWELLPLIKEYAVRLICEGIPGYSLLKDGVLIGENVKIYDTATIEGPAILGSGTEVRPGAFVRGCLITGENCVLGNSTELKNSILLNNVQVPHYNYVGDSVLGNYAHMGAGTVCSNLKSDGENVVVHGDVDYETGLRKLGGIMGDHADAGCGCVLNPGTVVGKGTNIYPLTSLRGVYPENSIVKSVDNIVEKR